MSVDRGDEVTTLGAAELARRIAAGDLPCRQVVDAHICDGGEVWECRCGSARCRGTIVSSFFALPIAIRQQYLPLLDD